MNATVTVERLLAASQDCPADVRSGSRDSEAMTSRAARAPLVHRMHGITRQARHLTPVCLLPVRNGIPLSEHDKKVKRSR